MHTSSGMSELNLDSSYLGQVKFEHHDWTFTAANKTLMLWRMG